MAKITFIEHNGTVHEVDVPVGTSIMQAAVSRGVPGIEGDCGGKCACATCHVYIPADWKEKCPPAEELEQAMLDFAVDVDERSRLGCQIEMSDELDGITIDLPERQY
ncbi:MAG: 2Fe-2S iron-sulfur cluster binding domain-containing protein [Pseudomonadales bacterium]|nr:2Fe-2S iron-sulfur cluster binding domain-containing protein [Pseudomonadales bacterium]